MLGISKRAGSHRTVHGVCIQKTFQLSNPFRPSLCVVDVCVCVHAQIDFILENVLKKELICFTSFISYYSGLCIFKLCSLPFVSDDN